MVNGIHGLYILAVGMFMFIFVLAFMKAKLSDGRSSSALVLPLMVIVFIIGLKYGGSIFAIFLGDSPKKPTKLHIGVETWKLIGLIAAAVVLLGLLIALCVYGVKRLKAWYGSPAKVEARAAQENEVLQRIRAGVGDNPDIQDLKLWSKQLSKRSSPLAAELLATVGAELKRLEEEEERAALQPIIDGLAGIRFRNDPVEPTESDESPQEGLPS